MRALTTGMLGVLLLLTGWLGYAEPASRGEGRIGLPPVVASVGSLAAAEDLPAEDLTEVMQRYCMVCHNDQLRTGNLSLQGFDVANPVARAQTAEKVIKKLRVGMMPPPGMPRPGGDTLLALVEELEGRLDRAAAANPNPGSRSFQRLNVPEYENSIRELLGLEVDASEYLTPDTKSNNFDNIVDVQLMSPTLIDGFLRAASEISRLAVGDPHSTPKESRFQVAREVSQTDRIEGAPFGTRGGISLLHNFLADGVYMFAASVFSAGVAAYTGETWEQLEISLDGERVALLNLDRWQGVGEDNEYVEPIWTEPVFVRSGPHQVTAAFVRRYEGPVADLVSPYGMSRIGLWAGGQQYGIHTLDHLSDFVIRGPYNATGVSETPSRQKIFTCRPLSPTEARPCATEILSRLAAEAFRRPVRGEELNDVMSLYEQGEREGGFEVGVRTGLEYILASPHFVFRFEEAVGGRAGESYRIGDFDLASRLSYFLWATPPDEELLALARQEKLSDRRVLEAQARRMLADPRSEALATRFLHQWLRLEGVERVSPDVFLYANYNSQLGKAMKRETELFFYDLVRNDRSALELFTADYTFVNERLAKHYGIQGVAGEEFRRVQYPDATRRGLLGHASVLMLTSIPARTSPVLRGKWVMEVILGTPPPPPPPGVPALEETKGETEEGRVLTTRERMELHRRNPTCNACHRFMDPLGLALDNFDVVGKWRIWENGAPLDTRGEIWDGTPVSNPAELQQALLKRPVPLLRNFTEQMMAYALGRRVEYYDMPAVRKIVDDAAKNDYRMSSFILGTVTNDAFRMRKPSVTATESNGGQ